MQASPYLSSVDLCTLELQSDTHANTPWPWNEITIDTLDIADLCKLPNPSGGEGRPRRVICRELVFSERLLEVRVFNLAREAPDMHTRTHTHTDTHIHTHTHEHTRTHTHTHTLALYPAYGPAHKRPDPRTHTATHTYTHAKSCMQA